MVSQMQQRPGCGTPVPGRFLFQTGDRASTFAPFFPQREHFSRSSVCHSGTTPNV